MATPITVVESVWNDKGAAHGYALYAGDGG